MKQSFFILAVVIGLSLLTATAYAGFSSSYISNPSSKAVAATAGGDPAQKNMVRLDNEMLIAVWEDVDNDVRCAQSTDNGATWSSETEIGGGTYQWPSIATNGTRAIVIADQTGQGDIQYSVTDTGCAGFSSLADAAGLTSNLNEPAVAYDGVNNQWVICAYDSAEDTVFINATLDSESGTWTRTEIGNARNTNMCGIDVTDDGDIYIAVDDQQGIPDNLMLYNSSDNFVTSTSRSVHTGSDGSSVHSVSINTRGDHILITGEIETDTLLVVYSNDSGETFHESTLGSLDSEDLSGCIDGNGLYHIIFTNETGADDVIGYVNHSGPGGFGAPVLIKFSTDHHRYPTTRCSNFPKTNRMNYNKVEYTFYNRTSTDSFGFATYTFGDVPNTSFVTPTLLQEFMINDTVNISFNETGGTSVITNVTFQINGTVHQGVNNSENLWEYNHTLPMNTSKGNFTIKALFYDSDIFLVGTSNQTIVVTPRLSSVADHPDPIKGGGLIAIEPSGVNDSNNDNLRFYCSENATPDSSNTQCSQGDSSYANPYSAMNCTFTATTDDAAHTVYCRVYDLVYYSSAQSTTYTTDSTPPTLSSTVTVTENASNATTSVAKTIPATFYDNVNDGYTNVTVIGEYGMLCRHYTTDNAYNPGTGLACVTTGTNSSCTVTTDTEGSNTTNIYIACADNMTNSQNTSQNIDIISFVTDWTAPQTSDSSNTIIHSPDYNVTITESDNVDSDPETKFCTDTTDTCTPNTVSDGGVPVIEFNSSHRGPNYLRYNSTDDAGNAQSTQSSTININRLPVLTSASASAETIKGGLNISITTVSNETDGDLGQAIFLYVCNTSEANSSGCITGTLCSNTTSKINSSCNFTSSTTDAVYDWFVYIFDNSTEAAVNNGISGTYISDSTAPIVTVATPENKTYTQSTFYATISLGESADSALYSMDSGANVTMTSISSTLWIATLNSIADGVHTIQFFANDSIDNMGTSSVRTFTVDTSGGDTTPPSIVVLSPLNNSLHSTLLLNISMDENSSAAWYSLDNAANVSMGNASLILWNTTITPSQGSHNISFFANDTSQNTGASSIIFFTFDNTSPQFSAAATDPSTATDNASATCHSSWSDNIELAFGIVEQNSSGSFVNTTFSLSGTSADLNLTIPAANLSKGGVTCVFYVNDTTSNENSTSTSFTVTDVTNPILSNITYSPSSTGDLDPGVSVNVTANATDNTNLSILLLQFKENNASKFLNFTMHSLSGDLFTGNFTANTTNNWTFRVLVEDDSGNQNISSTETVSVSLDKTWTFYSTIPSVKSVVRSEPRVISLGNVSVNNTGDHPLEFNLSSSAAWITFNGTENTSTLLTIPSGSSGKLNVTANTTGFAVGSYNFTITSTANDSSSSPSSNTASAQINIQNTPGPFLSVTITTFTSAVSKGDSGVTYVSKVENLGTSDASGVWLAWDLPAEFSNQSGTLNRSIDSLTVGSSATNTITIDVSSTADNKTVTINATASSSEGSSSSDSKSVSIGIPTTVTTTVTQTTTTEVGGGGSTGGATTSQVVSAVLRGKELLSSKETVELVRGGSQLFPVTVKNIFEDAALEDVTMKIEGFFSQYLEFSPVEIESIPFGESAEFLVTVTSPDYMKAGTHWLSITITGKIIGNGVNKDLVESRTVTLVIHEVSESQASQLLKEAESALEEMKKAGFPTDQLSGLLADAKKALEQRDFSKVWELSKEIESMKKNALEASDLIESLKNDIASLSLTGSPDSLEKTEELLRLAEAAFEREDYTSALQRAREAMLGLAAESSIFNPVLFLLTYWWAIIIAMFLASATGVVGYRAHTKATISERIRRLEKEEQTLKELLKETQRDYLEKGKLGYAAYHSVLSDYQKRLAKIKKERTTLRHKRVRLLKPNQVLKDLDRESNEVMSSLKQAQEDYLEKGKTSRDEYKGIEKELNGRIAEIEGERMVIESKHIKPGGEE